MADTTAMLVARTSVRSGPRARVLVLALGLLLAACEPPPQPMPDLLIGEWRSDARGYEHRRLDFRSDLVSFGTGRFSSEFYFFEGVEELPSEDASTIYRIHLREKDGEISTMDLAYWAGNPAKLQFVNRRAVWVRSNGTAAQGNR